VLAIFGAADQLLPVEQRVAVYREALAKVGNDDVTIRVFADAGHLLTLPPREGLAPGHRELILSWLGQRVTIVHTLPL
jgi:hypothetical protein